MTTRIMKYGFLNICIKETNYLWVNCKRKILSLTTNVRKLLVWLILFSFSFFIRWMAFGLCQRATHFSQRLSTLIFTNVCQPYTKIVSIKQHRFVFFNVTIKSFPKELTTTLKKIFLYKSFSSLSICVPYKRCYGIGINKMNLPPFK